jgi:hypothetical protein
MKFLLDAFLRDALPRAGGWRRRADGIGENVGERESAIAQAGEEAVEVGGLFGGQLPAGDFGECRHG